MNANELADEFKNRDWDEVDCVLWCEKSANMLRQQADRIAELEKLVSQMKYEKSSGVYEKQSEPVGVVIEIEEVYGHTFKKRKSKRVQWSKEVDVGTQLYTTPQTKPLSDEEIWEVWQEIVNSRHGVTGQIKPFARAIEAKVRGEK